MNIDPITDLIPPIWCAILLDHSFILLVVSSSSSSPRPRRRRRPCPLCPGVVSVVATMRWSHGWIKWRTSLLAYFLYNLSYINIQIWKLPRLRFQFRRSLDKL